MTQATYWQRGESLDYMNDTGNKIETGEVIEMISRIGVAGTDILPKCKGSVHVTGIYWMAKKAGESFEAGQLLYYNGEELTMDEMGNTPAGYAAQNAEMDDEQALVKLLG